MTPSSIISTSTPKDNSNYTKFPAANKSTIIPDRFLTANLFDSKNNCAQNLSYYFDHENDHNYSISPPITDRTRKPNKPKNFEFGNNNNYTINTATPNQENKKRDNNTHNGQITRDIKDTQNEITENVAVQTNKLLENMKHQFYQVSESLQRKQQSDMIQALEQIHQTIIEFNTQQNQRKRKTHTQHRVSTHLSEF